MTRKTPCLETTTINQSYCRKGIRNSIFDCYLHLWPTSPGQGALSLLLHHKLRAEFYCMNRQWAAHCVNLVTFFLFFFTARDTKWQRLVGKGIVAFNGTFRMDDILEDVWCFISRDEKPKRRKDNLILKMDFYFYFFSECSDQIKSVDLYTFHPNYQVMFH